MTTFAQAVENQEMRTQNGMLAHKQTGSHCVDLFYKMAASRGKNIIPDFVKAYVENKDVALRILQWARDVRGGAGERQLFRDVLQYLEQNDPKSLKLLIKKVPEIGRWDDLLIFKTEQFINLSFEMIKEAILAKNQLCAKWMPRKGKLAVALREYMALSPKQYRKTLVQLTSVVEQKMCANDWDNINFNHVPSLASSRYKQAFYRHTDKFAEYVAALVRGDASAKVNAGAVYPYDVLKGIVGLYGMKQFSKTELDHICEQWKQLPNYVGESSVLPMVDVSGSMFTTVGGSVTALEVAVSLGIYVADKCKGKFKDLILTFSGEPELVKLNGTVVEKVRQLTDSKWGMNTNLHKALELVLKTATTNSVPESEMPKTILIFSDMQFDECVTFDDTAYLMIERKYNQAGYQIPNIVFWNLVSYDSVPVTANQQNVALVSGFSPSIAKAVLENSFEEFTPYNIMLKTVMIDRYDLL